MARDDSMERRHRILRERVLTRLADGTRPIDVIREYASNDDRRYAADVIAREPNRRAAARHATRIRTIAVSFGLLALITLLGLAMPPWDAGSMFGIAVAVVGHACAAHGLWQVRVWAFIGVPWWVGFLALGDLRGCASETLARGDVLLTLVFYAYLVGAAYVTAEMRATIFQYAGATGLRRDPRGELEILGQLED